MTNLDSAFLPLARARALLADMQDTYGPDDELSARIADLDEVYKVLRIESWRKAD